MGSTSTAGKAKSMKLNQLWGSKMHPSAEFPIANPHTPDEPVDSIDAAPNSIG